MEDDLDGLDPEIFKKLKMNGLVLAEDEVISGLDRTTVSLPMSYTSTGLFRKGSSIASENEFALLDAYVKRRSLISGRQYWMVMQKFLLMRWGTGMLALTVRIRGHVDLTARYRDMSFAD